MSAEVMAFDGGVFDTIGIRADAVIEAAVAAGWVLDREWVVRALPGRSLPEVILLAATEAREIETPEIDHTLVDIVALRAQVLVSNRMAQGAALVGGACDWIVEARGRGTRIVLRADSLRRDVEPMLRQAELEYVFTVVRCVDDLPRDRTLSSLENAYRAINQRLDALRESTERSAREHSAYASAIARTNLGFAEPTT